MLRFFRYLLVIGGAATLIVYLTRKFRKPIQYPTADVLIHDPAVDAVVELDEDGAFHILWSIPAESIRIYTGTSPQGIDYTKPIATIHRPQQATINNLNPLQPRYFALEVVGGARDGEQVITAVRELALAGAVNFRDIGGYRTEDGRYVKWGKVYRAGQLADMTESDLALIEHIGIKISCDLRLPEEVKEAPDRLPDNTYLESIPVQSEESRSRQIRRLLWARGRMDKFMTTAYTRVMVDNNPHVFSRLFELMADEQNLPLVIHCTAGKDRTGVSIALLLALLSVPDDVIIADYSLSNRYYNVFVDLGEDAIRSISRLGFTVETLMPLFTANPETIKATLAHVRHKYGSVEGYLMQAGGLSRETLAHVKTNLLQTKL